MHTKPFKRSAFSLVELMMGTIILALGLLIIGAVLPIAWRGSLETAALTRADGAADAAKFQVENHCLLDGPTILFDPTMNDPLTRAGGAAPSVPDGASYSFLGDYDTPEDVCCLPYVHALHLENWAVEPQNTGFLRTTAASAAVPEAPNLLDRLTLEGLANGELLRVGTPNFLGLTIDTDEIIGAPVVRFRDRVFPPISSTIPVPAPGDESKPRWAQWQEVLRSRKFAWAVLHRMVVAPTGRGDPRRLVMYFVTLRRGDSTNRYARQDHTVTLSATSGPVALSSADDVVFPVAWRVPLVLLPNQTVGVPGIAYAGNAEDFVPSAHAVPSESDCNLAQMFPPGTFFVDDLSGVAYRVMDREFVDPASTVARLTLDKDVRDRDDLPLSGADSGSDQTHRMVWVFPPPVLEANRPAAGDPVTFTGFNPVVDIRMEPLTLLP